jgi:lycopene cyclase domain-containing protein
MTTLYLWINIATLFFPLLLSFDKKVAFYKKWPFLFPAIAITGLFFLIWDHLFTQAGVWGFNHLFVTGIFIKTLPIEEILFFITVPYACVFIYECLIAYFPSRFNSKLFWLWIPLAFLILTLIGLMFFYKNMYSGATAIVILFLAGLKSVRQKKLLKFFIPAYLISIIPMFIVNGLLTAKPVVYYNPDEFSGIRIGTIPLEDFFYNLAMLLMCVVLYEYFKSLTQKKVIDPKPQVA